MLPRGWNYGIPLLLIVVTIWLFTWEAETPPLELAQAEQKGYYKGCINNLFLPPEEIKKQCKEAAEKEYNHSK